MYHWCQRSWQVCDGTQSVLQVTHAETLLSIDAQACKVLLQGDAIAFVIGSFRGTRRTQLMKLVNNKMKQGSASIDTAQVGSLAYQILA